METNETEEIVDMDAEIQNEIEEIDDDLPEEDKLANEDKKEIE